MNNIWMFYLFIYFCSWQEALTVYPRTNKQNHKKKRKVDPQTHQVMTMFTYSVVKYINFAHQRNKRQIQKTIVFLCDIFVPCIVDSF